jgi:Zn-dependent protease with chaperone function
MLISEESLNNLNENEFYFVLAHEMAHLIHKDSLNKTIFAANSMIDNDMMIATEKIVYYLFLIPGVKEFQRNVESNADRYAMNFLIKENIEFNCEKIFKTILKDKI